MSDTATRRQPISAVAEKREALTKDLEAKKAYLGSLRHELSSATGADKNRLLWMIKSEAQSVQVAQKALESFESPIVIPQLRLAGIAITFHNDRKAFDVAVLLNNDGILPALGSFELDLSVSYIVDYTQGPPLYRDDVFPKTTPQSTDIQPGGTNRFPYPNIPFIPNPDTGNALYTFDVLLYAGPDGVVADQSLHEQFLLRPRIVPVPVLPVVLANPA